MYILLAVSKARWVKKGRAEYNLLNYRNNRFKSSSDIFSNLQEHKRYLTVLNVHSN